MTWSINPESVLSTTQSTAIETFLTKIFNAVIDVLFTIVDTLSDFFTQKEVLWALVVIGLIYAGYKMLKRRAVSV
jgi:hypothetical protein